MKRRRIQHVAAALAALSPLLALPARAGVVYVPVLDTAGPNGITQTTSVWVANTGSVQRNFTTFPLAAGTSGVEREGGRTTFSVSAGSNFQLTGVGVAGASRLLEIDVHPLMAVQALLARTDPASGRTFLAPLPAISSENLIPADTVAYLVGLTRNLATGTTSDVAIVNLATTAAQCEARFLGANGAQIGPATVLGFQPLSMRYFADALGTIGQTAVADARLHVTCDQTFYAFAFLSRSNAPDALLVTPTETGASTLIIPGTGGGGGGGGGVGTGEIFQINGLVHRPTVSNPKRTVAVPVDEAKALSKLTVDLDFVPGPWNTIKSPNNHAIFWLHRGKFRSNTIANVNAFGPTKLSFKAAQNINMKARTQTDSDKPIALVQGVTYHVKYTYDAAAGLVTAVVSQGSTTLLTQTFSASSAGGALTVSASGLVCEFGHYANQEGPEVASFDWEYRNLKIEMIE